MNLYSVMHKRSDFFETLATQGGVHEKDQIVLRLQGRS
jgi:hypothetical protein